MDSDGTTKLLMGEAVMFPRVIVMFIEWWNSFFPFWFFVTVVFAAGIIFIVWYSKGEGGIHYVANEKIPITMRKVKNPFILDLECNGNSFPAVKCSFSSQNSCYVLPFWGVPAHELFDVMNMNYSTMRRVLLEDDDSNFKNRCCAAEPIIRLSADEEQSLVLKAPHSVYFDGRTLEDYVVHLVIVMLIMEENIGNIEEPYIFAKATVVHVPAILSSIIARTDNTQHSAPIVPKSPKVNGIYVRESNSPTIGVLQHTYDGSLFSQRVNGVNIRVCITCCERSVNTVIFPCLHACVCTLCFYRCRACPMCRGPAVSYFITGPPTEIPQELN